MFDNEGTVYKGYSGVSSCKGVFLASDFQKVSIHPVHTRCVTKSCFIEVPLNQLNELILALQEVAREYEGEQLHEDVKLEDPDDELEEIGVRLDAPCFDYSDRD